jgi:sulfide:quinone oxidoreductase
MPGSASGPMLGGMSKRPTRVTIVGGGVAALEAMIALRQLAAERVQMELVTPTPEWSYRPLAVTEPFGLGKATRYDLVRIARDHGAAMHLAGVQAVRPDAHQLLTWDGRELDYELLLVAVGATARVSLPGSVTVQGPGYTGRFRTVLDELEGRRIRRVVFAVPAGASWPLPLYELALMTAARVAELGLRDVELSVVTPEAEPLELFGPAASESVRRLLAERDVALHTGHYPAAVRKGTLATVPEAALPADRVVSLPRLEGPALPGLPRDREGFIPTDPHGLVEGQRDVYAAGDATTCAIKQGGVATQQADAAAEAIAARAGANVSPRPFRPVLRGLLLTGAAPRYLRADVSGASGDSSTASEGALWWPPSKIAGRWLGPYLALNNDELRAPEGVAVEADLTAIQVHAMIGRDRDDNRVAVRAAPED